MNIYVFDTTYSYCVAIILNKNTWNYENILFVKQNESTFWKGDGENEVHHSEFI